MSRSPRPSGPSQPPRGLVPGCEKAGIQVLSDAVIDQIAAGEVVERPASVVKELVENALDADARRVRVEARDGGRALVAVTDDGIGMSAADALLSLQRHATSKLRATADLEQIHTFGFRGEALPSIASVSRMRLRTRLRAAGEGVPEALGHEIRLEAGRIVSQQAVSAPEGTRIEVADLFANVPARQKFMKRAQTEWGHIADWMSRLSLALPGVRFELRRDDREALVWPETASPLERIAAVLSEKEANALVAVEREDAAAHVQAFVSSPEHTRPNTGGLYLFVNERPVRDRLMRQALLEAYRDWLPRGRFPTAVLFLTVARDAVDVNVHPAKWEVRFADPRAIHRAVRHSVREAIATRSWLGASDGLHRRPADTAGRVADAGAAPADPWRRSDTGGADGEPASAGRGFALEAASGPGPSAQARPAAAARPFFADLRVIGQLRASYLLAESDAGLLVVDQHAAHERILYERLRAQWFEHGVEAQGLLIPASVALEPSAVAALEAGAASVTRLGFEVETFAEDAVLVRAVPSLLEGRDPADGVRQLAAALGERVAGDGDASDDGGRAEQTSRWLPVVDRLFATLACHAARRFGDHLVPQEQRALLAELDTIPWAPTCPHGRPVAVAIGADELERRFRR